MCSFDRLGEDSSKYNWPTEGLKIQYRPFTFSGVNGKFFFLLFNAKNQCNELSLLFVSLEQLKKTKQWKNKVFVCLAEGQSHRKPIEYENVPVFLSHAVLHMAVENVSSECL